MSDTAVPFRVNVPQAAIEDLHERLLRARFPDHIAGSGWSYGTDPAVLKDFVEHWLHAYDWREQEAGINRFEQFVTTVQGEKLHYIHVRSPEPDAVPIVLTHGWPGSVVEFLEVIAPLADPVAHGGDPADAFHVVCPSIPGYGFSGPTQNAGMDSHRVADTIAELMAQLGYGRYIAQGGDWGSIITRRLAEAYPESLIGAHFNMLFCMPPDMSAPEVWQGVTDSEREAMGRAAERIKDGIGYMAIQGTKPQTLSYGLNDSPVGLLGWILEKFHSWMDCDGNLDSVCSKDKLLTNIAVYWFTETANSAARLYCESDRSGVSAMQPWDGRIDVPTGYARFPGEILQPARVWAEQRYNIVHWTDQPKGGHFAAFEQPQLFVDDLRAFGRVVRS